MIKCEVIQDLLPLYSDNVASEGSRKLVEEHIENCPDCRKVLETIQSGGAPILLDIDKEEIGALKKMKRKIRKKNIVVAAVSVACAIAIISGVFLYATPLPYDEGKISANLAYDQVIDIYYDGNYSKAISKQVGDTVYIGYEGTLFTRLYYSGEKKQFSIGLNIMVDYGGNGEVTELIINGRGDTFEVETDTGRIAINHTINRVYYLDPRKINLEGAEFELAKQDAVLIWER